MGFIDGDHQLVDPGQYLSSFAAISRLDAAVAVPGHVGPERAGSSSAVLERYQLQESSIVSKVEAVVPRWSASGSRPLILDTESGHSRGAR